MLQQHAHLGKSNNNLRWHDFFDEFFWFVNQETPPMRLPRNDGIGSLDVHSAEHVVKLYRKGNGDTTSMDTRTVLPRFLLVLIEGAFATVRTEHGIVQVIMIVVIDNELQWALASRGELGSGSCSSWFRAP